LGGLDIDHLKSKLYSLGELLLCLGAILAVAAVLCMFMVGVLLAAEALFPRRMLPESFLEAMRSASRGQSSTYMGLAVSFLAYTGVGLAVLIVARYRGDADWRDLIAWRPWSLRRSGRRFWLIVGAAFAYGFAADFALTYFYPPTEAWLAMPKDKVAAALLFVIAVVFAPLVEEVVFRGWIFTNLRSNFGFATALFASSIIFAGLHYESTHLYALAVFPVGLALGAIREITGSVKSTIAIHAFNNFIASCLGLLDSS